MKTTTCAGCGARIDLSAEKCGLCGLETDESSTLGQSVERATAPVSDADQRVCSQCATVSEAEARYCFRCGNRLAAVAGPARPPEPRRERPSTAPGASAGRYALFMTGGAVVAVIALFAITQISGRVDPLRPAPDGATAQVAAPDLSPEEATRISGLEERIAATDDGAERMSLRQELVDALVSLGAFARAGEVQEAIAREAETVDAWAEAGSFFLAHVLRTDSPEQPIFAERSARAFERALELRPGDLDIKTDLATAYRYHPQDPMRAVNLIQEVLAEDEDHARARFNYGVMLAEIGRNEQARAQFERVVGTPGVDEFVRERARELLESTPG